MMKRFIAFSIFLLMTQNVFGVSQEVVRVDRYSLMEVKASRAQADLLSVIVNINVPNYIVTVGETLEYVLQRSGFSMASDKSSDPALPILLKQKLPRVHRHLGPISLRHALKTLAGHAWTLVEDPVNRMVSFQLLDKYSNFRPAVNRKNR